MDSNLTFGQWLKRRRRGLGLTQRGLGERLGYSSETVRKVEADELRPSRQLAERLAAVLEVDPADWVRLVRFARDEPDPNAQSLPTQTVQLPAGAAPSAEPRRHNLPAPLTTFIGREQAIAEIRQLLDTRRLVTLTGAGGMGKSRLSVEVASGLLHRFTHGVWLVELSALADPRLVSQAVAAVLSVRQAPGQPVAAALNDYVREKSLLLVLDNCEHLIEACALLAQALLHAAPALQILATSREALGVAGEITYDLPSLSLPAARESQPVLPDHLLSYEAAQLFVDRAVTVLSSFTVTETNARALAQVCQHLEGMPLALELAAARIKALRVEQIAARLHDRFALLSGGSRTGLPRHQTLKATIDWSYELLPEAERAVLRRVAVFAGGWTLEAAEVVCAGPGVAQTDVLDRLASLTRKSMVVVKRIPDGEARYRLLDSIREYAGERLRAAGEQEIMHLRHLRFFAELTEEAEPHLRQADQAQWLRRLLEELDNVRTALAWSLEGGHEVVWGVRLAAAMWHYWDLFGHIAEAVRWLDLALAAQEQQGNDQTPESMALRGRLLVRFACVLMWVGNSTRAASLSEAALRACRDFGTDEDLAFSLIIRGCTTWRRDGNQGQQFLEEAIQQSQARNLKWFEASAHYFLCNIARNRQDYDETERHGQICLTMCRELGEHIGAADTLAELAMAALARERYTEAAGLFDECARTYRALHVHGNLVPALIDCGEVAQYLGDFVAARDYYDEALALAQEQGRQPVIAQVEYVLGNLARREGDYDQAETWLQQSLTRASAVVEGNRVPHAYLHWAVSAVARCRGDWRQAAAELRVCFALLQADEQPKRGLVLLLRELALLCSAVGQPAEAAQMFAAVEANAAGLGVPVPPVDRAEYERALAMTQAALDKAAYAAAWAKGQAMTLERAAAYGLEQLRTVLSAEP